MKIQLPLENWADVLPFVPRLQLVEIVKQLGDRQFAKILQFFLTQVGQITLCHLRIVAPPENDPNGSGPIVEVYKTWWDELVLKTNLPDGPMPTNVKDFELIDLSYFDMSVANFLRQFQQEQQQLGNSLLDNVNLRLPAPLSARYDNTIMPILAQLMPMIGNINSISFYNLHHRGIGCVRLETYNAAYQLLTTQLANARILDIRDDMQMLMYAWYDWLYAPRNDGKPRVLRLIDFSSYTKNLIVIEQRLADFFSSYTKNLIEQIKKDFLATSPPRPVSFFVYVRTLMERRYVDWQDICLDNGQTNERLMVKTIEREPRRGWPRIFVLISRYPVGANQEWIEANEQEIMGWNFKGENRQIRFKHSLEINGGHV